MATTELDRAVSRPGGPPGRSGDADLRIMVSVPKCFLQQQRLQQEELDAEDRPGLVEAAD
jgi:hypothetical protein